MRCNVSKRWMLTGVMAVLFMAFCNSAMAAEKTIIGVVNDNYQIVSDNQIYEIEDTEKGKELAENHVGAKVQATGSVEERDDMKMFTVFSYKVLSE